MVRRAASCTLVTTKSVTVRPSRAAAYSTSLFCSVVMRAWGRLARARHRFGTTLAMDDLRPHCSVNGRRNQGAPPPRRRRSPALLHGFAENRVDAALPEPALGLEVGEDVGVEAEGLLQFAGLLAGPAHPRQGAGEGGEDFGWQGFGALGPGEVVRRPLGVVGIGEVGLGQRLEAGADAPDLPRAQWH